MLYQIEFYRTSTGQIPFDRWFKRLKDPEVKSLIFSKFDRVTLGNFGDTKYIGDGISEFRLHCGPGYRLYYAKIDNMIILLLCGGTKGTQTKDIELAKHYLLDFQMQRSMKHGKRKKN